MLLYLSASSLHLLVKSLLELPLLHTSGWSVSQECPCSSLSVPQPPREPLQLRVPPVGLFVLPSVLPTISTAATMCSEVPPTYHTVVPTSINLLQHSTTLHIKKKKEKKKAEIFSVFSFPSNLITPRFLCTFFHIHLAALSVQKPECSCNPCAGEIHDTC